MGTFLKRWEYSRFTNDSSAKMGKSGNFHIGDLKSMKVPNSGWRAFTDKIPARYIFVIMGFIGMVNVYTLRVNLSVAIVAMVNHTAIQTSSNSSTECLFHKQDTNSSSDGFQEGEFNWDFNVQGLILGSFFYGYIITVIPGGVLAEKYGPKWLFGVGVLITAVLSILLPLAAHMHYGVVIALRVIQGLGEGVTFPAMHCMIAHWTPIFERSRATAIIQAGSDVGAVVAMIFSGILANSNVFGGWPSVFYVYGLVGVIWFVFWSFLVYNTPEDHPRISDAELEYIQRNMGEEKAQLNPPIPWRKILGSAAVWSGVLSHFGFNWIHYVFLSEMPTYLATVLHFDMDSNGFLSALPYILGAIGSCVASFLADHIRKHKWISTTNNRKLFNSIGMILPAVLLLPIPTAGCDRVWNILLLCIAGMFHGVGHVGFMVSYIDLAPDFAGTLLGISNIGGSIPGFLIPSVLGVLIKNENSLKQWGKFFYIGGAIGIVTGLEFILFGSAKLQSWGITRTSNKGYGASERTRIASIEDAKQ